MHEYLAGNYQWQGSCILAGKSRVVFATVVRFSKVPQLFWSFLGAKIPFMFSQRRGSKSSKESSWFFLQ